MNKIKLLSNEIINQIAAGEVVDGPSAALKEIVENAIDANAKNIDIFIKSGGKAKIVVTDDGDGFASVDDMKMSFIRHATSKLTGCNLFDISSYGFRGEAIPSIASVSDFSIESIGTKISQNEIQASNITNGTKVCVENIFKNVPVRLKFLKSDNIEKNKCINIIENFSITRPDISFLLRDDNKQLLNLQQSTFQQRVQNIYGEEMFKNALYFDEQNDIARIYGFLFHPIHSNLSATIGQKLFINNRIVKNKILAIAARVAYRNIVNSSRYPIVLLCMDIDPFYVDVNVSPTKAEVRFRNEKLIQDFIISTFEKNVVKFNSVVLDLPIIAENKTKSISQQHHQTYCSSPKHIVKPTITPYIKEAVAHTLQEDEIVTSQQLKKQTIFGKAICQLFDTYILTYNEETNDFFIIDQHAVYEKIELNKLI